MQEGLEARLLRTPEALADVRAEWKTLWARDPGATPFQRPEWLLPWWSQFGQPDLRVAEVRRGGTLVGLLPAYVLEEEAERKLLLLGAGTSDYLDGIWGPECGAAGVEAALDTVLGEPGWEVADFFQLRTGSPLAGVLEGRSAERTGAEATSHMPALPIAELPKKVRADVRYFRNAAIARGRLELRVAEAGECLRFFGDLVRLHTANWAERGEPGVLADERVLAWHKEALPGLAEAGVLRMYGLDLGGERVAVLYGLMDPAEREGRAVYLYLVGHAPEYAEVHPGTLLTAMAVEHAAAEGARWVDMLRGEEAYKRFWKVGEVPTLGFRVRAG